MPRQGPFPLRCLPPLARDMVWTYIVHVCGLIQTPQIKECLAALGPIRACSLQTWEKAVSLKVPLRRRLNTTDTG